MGRVRAHLEATVALNHHSVARRADVTLVLGLGVEYGVCRNMARIGLGLEYGLYRVRVGIWLV